MGVLGCHLTRQHRAVSYKFHRSLRSASPERCPRLLERASLYRPGTKRDVVSLTKLTLRMLALRALSLQDEIDELDAILKPLVQLLGAGLLAVLAPEHRVQLRHQYQWWHGASDARRYMERWYLLFRW